MTKPNASGPTQVQTQVLTQEPNFTRSAKVGVGTTPEDALSGIYDIGALVCPECTTYLLDKYIEAQQYKNCNSCGYTRKAGHQLRPLIGDNAGAGIDPLIGQDFLKRPEERNGTKQGE